MRVTSVRKVVEGEAAQALGRHFVRVREAGGDGAPCGFPTAVSVGGASGSPGPGGSGVQGPSLSRQRGFRPCLVAAAWRGRGPSAGV